MSLPFVDLTLWQLLTRFAAFLLVARSVVHGFRISGFWWALLASVLISLATTLIGSIVKSGDD